jgi:hypothetical protein
MTRQKSFKRTVRTRMQKTDERYTAARRQLIAKSQQEPQRPAAAADLPDFEPPVSDASVSRATGRGWREWLAVLDDWGATQRSHTEIARWLMDEQNVASWWAQSVAVGYERARGMRDLHQQAGGYSIGASRTVAVSADELLAAFTDPGLRASWLPDAQLAERSIRPGKSARFDWLADGSRLVVGFERKGKTKAQVALIHEKLSDPAAAERMKVYWRERLNELKRLLESDS